MKNLSILFLIACFIQAAQAQINIGVNVNPGLGYIRSNTLNKILESAKSSESQVIHANARTGAGANIGLGGFIQYNISPKVSILAEPTFNLLFSRIYLNFKQEALDANGNGWQTRVASTAKVRSLYVNLPIVVRYTIWEKRKVFASGGISVNFNTKPHLRSEESIINTDYAFENVKNTTVENKVSSASLDKFNLVQPHLVIGIGKNFRRKLKMLSLDVRYSIPLTKTSMYTSDENLTYNTSNNSIFGPEKEWNMGNSPQMIARPENFRMGMINLSIKYILYQKKNN